MVLSKKDEPMNPRLFEYAKGLHDFIKEKYKATIVWVLQDSGLVIIFMSKERKEHCITITGGFMVKAVHPLLGIAIFVYFISAIITHIRLQIKAGILISKKPKWLKDFGVDKILLFLPQLIPLSLLQSAYEKASDFDTDKYELEDYIDLLKLYRKVFLIPIFIIICISGLYALITVSR